MGADLLSGPEGFVLLIAVSAFFVGGILKGAMGFGLPLLAIPAMTAAHSLPMALSIAVIPVISTNIWQLWSLRAHRHEPKFLPGFLMVGALGLIFGVFALSWVRDAYLEIALGGLVLTYLLLRWRGSTGVPKWANPRLAPVIGGAAGAVHGATGLSGLVGTPYMHAMSLPRPVFVFSNGAMFTLFSSMQAPTLWALGLYQPSAILIGALTLPAAFGGVWIGTKLGARLNTEAFSRAVLFILGIAAIIPVWNGLRDILAL
ncbi:sulfite exporter TauE/SafE family protein [Gymnodinialimonas sp.]